MDASSYGRMVERGGSATGGTVNSPGFVLVGESGGCVMPAAGLVSRLDTTARDPDDGTTGVPAKV